MSETNVSPEEIAQELEAFREQIDVIDKRLMELIAERFDIVHQVGVFKARTGLEVVQAARAQEVIERAGALAEAKGVDPELMMNFYRAMIDVAHKIEHDIVGTAKERL